MPETAQLAGLEYQGDATRFAHRIHALIPKCPLLENFSHGEVRLLAHFMEVYRAEAGVELPIRSSRMRALAPAGRLVPFIPSATGAAM